MEVTLVPYYISRLYFTMKSFSLKQGGISFCFVLRGEDGLIVSDMLEITANGRDECFLPHLRNCFSVSWKTADCTVPTFTSQLSSSDCTASGTVTHGTTCTYMCASGFSLQGSATAMCTSGTLTPPTCEGK